MHMQAAHIDHRAMRARKLDAMHHIPAYVA